MTADNQIEIKVHRAPLGQNALDVTVAPSQLHVTRARLPPEFKWELLDKHGAPITEGDFKITFRSWLRHQTFSAVRIGKTLTVTVPIPAPEKMDATPGTHSYVVEGWAYVDGERTNFKIPNCPEIIIQ